MVASHDGHTTIISAGTHSCRHNAVATMTPDNTEIESYSYPKIPRDYHESVTRETVASENVILLEKFDGSNAKVFVYDNRFDDALYPSAVFDFDNLQQGDVFIGTKNNVKKRLSDPISDADGALNRLQSYLRDALDSEELLDVHETYNSPIMLFGENIGVQTTLEYNRLENNIPVFLGFDVLVMKEYDTPPANPFNERFDAYLPFDEMKHVFETVGVQTARVIEKDVVNYSVSGSGKDISITVDVPKSVYADVTAEGVVIRNDERNRRVKCTSDEFEERNNISWSKLEEECSTGSELFCARYVTNQRIRKNVVKHRDRTRKSVADMSPDVIADVVLADVWEEELDDIMTIKSPIQPNVIRDRAWNRCRRTLNKMQTNVKLNNTTVKDLWKSFNSTDQSTTNSVHTGHTDTPEVFDISIQQKHCLGSIAGSQEPAEKAFVRHIVSPSRIIQLGERIAGQQSKEFGNWVIPQVDNELQESLWYENLELLANSPTAYTPSELRDETISYIRKVITNR